MTEVNFEMMKKIADAIVDALVDRLAADERFIKAVADSPWMREAIASTRELPSDMVETISKHVEHALEHLEVSADNISDFESSVEQVINNYDMEASSISGLEEFVNDTIDEKSITVDHADVDGLDSAISEAIDDKMDEIVDKVKNAPDLMEAVASSLQLTVK